MKNVKTIIFSIDKCIEKEDDSGLENFCPFPIKIEKWRRSWIVIKRGQSKSHQRDGVLGTRDIVKRWFLVSETYSK